MFSKKLLWGFAFIFIFLSVVTLLTNMPEKKNKRVFHELTKFFPYKIKKEFGGLDIVDKRTGKDLDVANEKVFIAYDALLKKWGRKHLLLSGYELIIVNDEGKEIGRIRLKDQNEVDWVKKFFGL